MLQRRHRLHHLTLDRVVVYVREYGPVTMGSIAAGLHCSLATTKIWVGRARHQSLLKLTGKDERGRLIFAAVQTTDWPVREMHPLEMIA